MVAKPVPQSAARSQRRPLEHRGELDDHAACDQARALKGGAPLQSLSCPPPAGAAGPPGSRQVVLESEVVILDPHFPTAAITRTFGYHVYDTLFAMDDGGQSRPQMVEQFASSSDHLRWLRDGLRWHVVGP